MTKEDYIQIINRYSDSLFRIAYSICQNRQDAEDAVQTTFFKFYTLKKNFQNDEHIKNYLIKMTVNHCKSIFSASWKKKVVLFDEFKNDEYYTLDTNDEHYELYKAVMSLPEKLRIVIHLYYFEDYSVKEISELISVKETTIQTRLMRARTKLKIMLEENWQDEN
jgi:RNA polymerase sigma-70 factor (ECF subfamily)